MKIHVPMQILLDPENDPSEKSDFEVRAAHTHAIIKAAIKANSGEMRGDAYKSINKSVLGAGGFKAVHKSLNAISGIADACEYVLLKSVKTGDLAIRTIIADMVLEMVMMGRTKSTFYISEDKQGKLKLSLYAPLIRGKGNVLFKVGNDEKSAAIAFVQHFKQVEQLHRAGYCHNDIKGPNFMFDTATSTGTLIDFGSCTRPWYYSKATGRSQDFNAGIGWFDKTFPGSLPLLLSLSGKSYGAVKRAGLAKRWPIAMFGVHYDMGSLYTYGKKSCAPIFSQGRYSGDLKKIVESGYHPAHMSQLVDKLIGHYKLYDLKCKVFPCLKAVADPKVVANPPEARWNMSNFNRILEGVTHTLEGERFVAFNGVDAGGSVSRGNNRGQEHRDRLEEAGLSDTHESLSSHLEEEDNRRGEVFLNSDRELSEEDSARVEGALSIASMVRNSERFSDVGVAQNPFVRFAQQLFEVSDLDSMQGGGVTHLFKEYIKDLVWLVNRSSIHTGNFGIKLDRLFVAALLSGEPPGMHAPMLRQMYFMVVVHNKSLLAKHWDPRIASVGSLVEFCKLVLDKSSLLGVDPKASSEGRQKYMSTLLVTEKESQHEFNFGTNTWKMEGGEQRHYVVEKSLEKSKSSFLSVSSLQRTLEQGGHSESEITEFIVRHSAVSNIDRHIRNALEILFSREITHGIYEYYQDIEAYYRNPPEISVK